MKTNIELREMLERIYQELIESYEAYKNGEDDDYYEENEVQNLYDYVAYSYDIKYTKQLSGDLVGCSLCVACGCPNIYINTIDNRLEDYWGNDAEYLYFRDYQISDMINNIVEELADYY